MSISISDYLESLSAITSVAQNTSVTGNSSQTESTSTDKDSYIASGIDADTVLPSENYNNILDVMKSAKSEQSQTSTDSEEQSGTESVGSGNGGGSGSGSDEDEDETTTKLITIGGITYLETTTVSNGITTVTRTEVG